MMIKKDTGYQHENAHEIRKRQQFVFLLLNNNVFIINSMYICRCPKCGIFLGTPSKLRDHLLCPHDFAGNGELPNLASLEKYAKTPTLNQDRRLSKQAKEQVEKVCETRKLNLAELKNNFRYA